MSMVQASTKENFTNIGVLVRKSVRKKLLKQTPTPIFHIIQETSQKVRNINLYMFSKSNIDFDNSSIIGVAYNPLKKEYEEKKFPIPHVMYRRTSELSDSFIEKVRNNGTKFINSPKGFNNWVAYNHLNQSPDLQKHLPFTKICKDVDEIKTIFNFTNKIYVKSLVGGRGKHVMKIKKIPFEGYFCSYFNRKLFQFHYKHYSSLKKHLLSFYNDHFIIQEAIDLLSTDDRPIDLRAELQRNGNGIVTITGISARRGEQYSPITTHSDSYSLEEFCRNKLNYSDDKLISFHTKVSSFLKEIYEEMEKIYGQCGEMGIDFALDRHENLFFIECNSRSTKVSLKKAYGEEVIKQSFVDLWKYAKYISTK
ncbi:YheC/YheD family protein [Evansella cellulosilytica]|uniref:ATP-grasp domain-containing protein n=1 Tax=Evansella cellulosilytica (strain ATCC 21833 / DSM 2522 / FERM P-1141 / JCM 9156 / N-4) TaxID=649639 RepID=E6TWB5_EVAC2|nr:YheC/YheD family protein [Evansella cellulosilytica]ADU31071.1 hypothetical protein Bcell_2818 [Evansella cellulosilytica DSM 2522]